MSHAMSTSIPQSATESELQGSLGLFDSSMVVAGSMIGTGIFIVAAEMSRQVGSAGFLLASWVLTLTVEQRCRTGNCRGRRTSFFVPVYGHALINTMLSEHIRRNWT
jgi:hypothetical protein